MQERKLRYHTAERQCSTKGNSLECDFFCQRHLSRALLFYTTIHNMAEHTQNELKSQVLAVPSPVKGKKISLTTHDKLSILNI